MSAEMQNEDNPLEVPPKNPQGVPPFPDFLKGVDLDLNTLDFHFSSPETSYEEYLRQKEQELAHKVSSRKSVYLDTRYWVHLRDSYLGRDGPPVYDHLLSELKRGVENGSLVCPFAADMLAEVYKQSDRATRLATARLIDELSLKVALKSEPERVASELSHGILALRTSSPVHLPLKSLVWTYSSFAVGNITPTFDEYDNLTELALQKAFLDLTEQLGFSHQVSDTELDEQPEDLYEIARDLSNRINNLNIETAKEEKTRSQIEYEEFSGVVHAHLPALEDVVRHLSVGRATGTPDPGIEREIGIAASQIGGMLCEAFRRNRLGNHFPTITIRAGLATAVRWDRKRKYKPNDFHDFGHAVAALPYFDIFATERSLHHLLVNELKYNVRYSTIIEHDPAKLLTEIAGR